MRYLVGAEHFGDFARRVALDIEPLDLGQERVLVGSIICLGGGLFSFQLFIHAFLAFSCGFHG